MQTGAHRVPPLARDAEDGDEFAWAGDADLVDEGLDGALAVDRVAASSSAPEDFTPSKIVFGILLKDGEDLTVDTLFPFAQVALR